MRLVLAFLLLVSLARTQAGEVTFSSGASRIALIELFTSEGCSSCPPAERWLSEQANRAELWRTFVPVSWHVDYWNRLGWPDRFSSREFTQRQYDYVAAWHGESVYTPCFVRDGREWRPRGNGALGGQPSPVGVLIVYYDGQTARAEFAPAESMGKSKALVLHVALLGGGIRSKVTAGENRGETLEHDFVALKVASGPLGENLVVPRAAVPGVDRYALAAWVTEGGTLTPLQAVGGWLE